MPWSQHAITLEPRPRGIHLVTNEIAAKLSELSDLQIGLAHIFIRHTSASLTLNENASPDVRRDVETWLNAAVPQGIYLCEHRDRGGPRSLLVTLNGE